ncbi:anion permease [Halogeometricum sp. CBA1124]|uniref:anion permease n=1 Tax=Halogeometricum sp. CBA1124 TaxID=2668071 RepID=UPI00374391C9
MLPVATPPNAVVFGTGYVTVPEMARAGLVLNLLASSSSPSPRWSGFPSSGA